MIIGHEVARAALERELPSVSLLLGPDGTGKRTLADHLLAHHDIHPSNIIRIAKLDAESARGVVEVCSHIPQGGLRVIVIDLDGCGEAAQNVILKALEEAPDPLRFILLSSAPPLATITSRAQVFRSGYLSPGQLEEALKGLGKDPGLAALAPLGTVPSALAQEKKSAEDAQREAGVVAAAVRAAGNGEWEAMNRSMRGWTPAHSRLLLEWCVQAMSGRTGGYPPDFSRFMTIRRARAVWNILGQSPDSPLMAAAALQNAFGG